MKPLCALIAALLLTVAAAAQGAKPPYTWEISGDTAETFKATFIVNHKPDQTTPAALVASYAAYADGRSSARAESDRVNKTWNEILSRTMEKYEKSLLTDAAHKALLDSLAKGREDTYTQTAGEMKVAEETDGAEGRKVIVTEQEFTQRRKQRDSDQWDESKSTEKQRFTCVKGDDGKWRIEKIEALRPDYSSMKGGDTEPPLVWKEESVILRYIYAAFEEAKSMPEIPDAKQDIPEAAAMALFHSLLPRKEQLNQQNISRIQGWTETIEPLFTKEFLAGVKTEAAEVARKRAEDKKKEPERAVEGVTDGTDGVKVVKFKPLRKWSGSVELHMRKVGDAWKIEKAGVFEKEYKSGGEPEEVFKVVEDLYSLRNR